MSLEEIKRAAETLTREEREELISHLSQSKEEARHELVGRMERILSDSDPKQWMSFEEFEQRLSERAQ